MKNFMSLTLCCMLVLSILSCSHGIDTQQVQAEKPTLYRLSVQNGQLKMEPITVDAFKALAKKQVQPRSSNNASANGIFNLGNLMCTFSAMENNSGVHGNSHLTGDGFFQDVRIHSDCITVIENVAFWGGEITKWVVSNPGLFPYGEGWIFVLSAIDNGEGNNANPDEVGSAFIVAPPETVPSDFGLPFDTWCDFAVADYDYDQGDHGHFYVPGNDPTNIQVNE